MPITLLASACPAPIAPVSFVWPEDCGGASPTDTPDVAKTITSGDPFFTPNCNENAAMLDLAARSGGGIYGVIAGLVVSAGTGLTVNVTGGVAAIEGYKSKKTFAALVVPASTARVWIWFKQDGTLQAVATSTTPPTSKCCLIGSCTTDGSGVTAVDESGVVRLVSGMPWRETADLGQPSDSPPAAIRLLAKTAAGEFFWDGVQWNRLVQGLAWNKDTIPSGETAVVPAGAQSLLFGTLSIAGRLTVRGKVRVTA